MNLSNLSLIDLRILQSQVRKQQKITVEQDTVKAREEIQAIALSMAISIEELVKGAVDKKSGKVAVRFRTPGNVVEQWTGLGRQPKWIKEWLEDGKALDAFRV